MDKWRSRWPCRRLSQARRWLPGQSCAPCSSRCERSCSRHSRSPPPRERKVWKTWWNVHELVSWRRRVCLRFWWFSLFLNVRDDVIHRIGGPPLDLRCVPFVVDPEGLGILLKHALCLTARYAVQNFIDVAEASRLQALLHAGPEGGRAILFQLLLLLW